MFCSILCVYIKYCKTSTQSKLHHFTRILTCVITLLFNTVGKGWLERLQNSAGIRLSHKKIRRRRAWLKIRRGGWRVYVLLIHQLVYFVIIIVRIPHTHMIDYWQWLTLLIPHSTLALFLMNITFTDQISSLSKSCYSHTRALRCIRPYVDSKTVPSLPLLSTLNLTTVTLSTTIFLSLK